MTDFQSSDELYGDPKSLESSTEIYGTNDNDGHVMSERVQQLAGSVYQEFEHMIKRYDEDVVKELMPLVVGILEALDLSYVEKQENEVEIELLRDDNEQLLNQYEREKQLRKSCEQKILELDDAVEEDRKQSNAKIESLESLVRMMELKGKNSTDHVFRLEQKEAEMKAEYQKLHERYTELFKSHMDYQERTKMLMVSDRMDIMSSSPRPKNFASVTLRPTGIPVVPIHELGTPQRMSSQFMSAPSPQQTPTDNKNFYDESRESEQNANTPRSIEEAIGSTLDLESSGEFPEQRESDEKDPDAQDVDYDSDGNDITGCDVNPGDFASSGVGKEVENLIQENNELLATKNALNIVKDDLIARVDELTSESEILREEIKSINTIRERGQEKIAQLEETIKKQKEEMETMSAAKNEEDDVPLVMRKRFTRVEMARVLMERNQYKERLMELQEAVRWTEMIRASREHPELVSGKSRNRSSIWNFFGNLFSSQNKPSKVPNATLRFSVPKAQVQPVTDPSSRTDKSKAYDFLQDEMMNEKSKKERARERKEQYKQVRAHVKKDDGRMQAYGWSLPTKTQAPIVPKEASRTGMPVPVPVYCRPLLEKEPATKLWCAAGVNLSGGRTKDGGAMVGASIFYSGRSKKVTVEKITDEVEKLDQEIKDHEKDVKAVTEDRQLSSLVWIVTSTHTNSQVTVIDANNPGDSLDSFNVTSAHILCITSVEGALESDYQTEQDDLPRPSSAQQTPESSPLHPSRENSPEFSGCGQISNVVTGSPPRSNPETPISPPRSHSIDGKDGIAALPMEDEFMYVEVERFSSVLPTMWMGSQRGDIYVHSSVSRWKQCLHTVRLSDSVLSIVHVKGRVLAALADGTVAAFHRANDGQWDFRNYHVLSLGRPQHSIRCMAAVANKNVWLGYGNRVHVVNPKSLKIENSFDAHPRKESQVRQLAWAGDGVWISIRLDSTLRLYHAYTYDHLQDVDIEPYVSKMLGTGKLGFSFVRITSLLISSMRLWIGTGNGVIISIPLSENSKNARPIASKTNASPGGVIRVYNDQKTDAITPGSFLPYCSMAQAQLSFHGHKDAVKFFTAVPGRPPQLTGVPSGAKENLNIGKPTLASTVLVISGGEGYVDFRIGDNDNDEEVTPVLEERRPSGLSHGDKSHLIVWEVSMTG